jgi:hypothetical protein
MDQCWSHRRMLCHYGVDHFSTKCRGDEKGRRVAPGKQCDEILYRDSHTQE